MLKKLLNNKFRILILIVLVSFLVMIRIFEENLFYDPLLNYFKSDYTNFPLPLLDNLNLFFGLFFRYFLNSAISIAIIYFAFKDLQLVKFASALYLIFFVILISVFFFVYSFYGEESKMTLFYIRRFLIQPLLLLLFIPGFYIQKQSK
ncbi:MAG: exosortase F system-associated protein [Flavobacteriaceae bacterium]|nr:exosortase F system-associated protein [Flavobacteriaceae bacterium]